jgi:hypothetical protein
VEEMSQELPAPSPEPANRVDSSQALTALGQVDEIYQAAVALFYLRECSYKEIAAILEVPIGTVKSRIARGITQLKEIMLSGHDKNPAISILEDPAARTEDILSQRDDSSKLNCRGRGYDEWDFASTLHWSTG